MKKSVFCLIISIIFSNTIFSQKDLINKSEIERLIASHLYDSVTVKARVIEELDRKNRDVNRVISGVIVGFVENKEEETKEPHYFSSDTNINIPKENLSVTDENGYFRIKLSSGSYIAQFSCLGYEIKYVEVNLVAQETQLDDIELKGAIIDDSDSFLEITTGSKIKLFFRRVYYRLNFLL